MRKAILFLIMLMILPSLSWGTFGIVNNSAASGTAQDSISFFFQNLDSLGQPLGGLDTTKILVVNAKGDSVFAEVIIGVAGRVGQFSTGNAKYDTSYVYKALVADIDGTAGLNGVYTVRIYAKSNETGAWLATTTLRNFQLIHDDLTNVLDSAKMGRAGWNNTIIAEASRTMNVAQISGDVTAADNLEAMLDGTTPRKTLTANLDGWTRLPENLIVSNGLFDIDSVTGTSAPARWTNYSTGADLTGNNTVTASKFGRWNYSVGGPGVDTIIYYQGIGYIAAGDYYLHGVASNRGGTSATVFIDTCLTDDCADLTTLTSAYIDSISEANTTSFRLRAKKIILPSTAKPFVLGFKFVSDLANDSCIFANIGLIPGTGGSWLAELTADSVADDSQTVDMSSFNAALDNDSSLVNFLRAGIGGGSSDSISIARWVWNTPQNNHILAGTFGKYLDVAISGISGGSGLYARQILLYDSSSSQIIPGANLTVRNLSQTALITLGTTNSQGIVSFNLDPDSFLVIPFAPGYLFNAPDTIIVSGGGVDTVFGYRFDPGAPSSPDLCRVYGWLFDASGNPEEDAVVSAYLPSGVSRIDTGIISPFKVTATTDSAGYFFLDLIPSESLIPDDTKYEITITRSDGAILRERVSVPQQSDWMLTW